MAKPASQKPASGSARIRFIMLEAEIPEGDLSQFTHAIQHALRPTTISVPSPRIVTLATQRATDNATETDAQAEQPTFEAAIHEPEQTEEAAPASPARRSTPRKAKVLDIDLNCDPSFAAFANEKKPDNHLKRYLVVAAWFKEARNINVITMDHVYTCYRSVGWPSNNADFGQPLRSLKRQQKMTQNDDGFVINHLGLQEVTDLGKA
jgi:hypothetical protein